MNVSSLTSQMGGMSAMNRMPPPPPPPDGGAGGPSTADILAELDTDASGGLSSSEIADSPLSKFINDDNFADVDLDGDGTLSLDELETHRESVTQNADAGMGPPPPPPDQTTDADPMSLIQSLLDDITDSSAATDTTASYAQDLYTAMQNLFGSLSA